VANLMKIGSVDSEIIGLQGIINKEKKKEINASKTYIRGAGMGRGLNKTFRDEARLMTSAEFAAGELRRQSS